MKYLLALALFCANAIFAATLPAGTHEKTIDVGGLAWTYFIHMPKETEKPLPLVLILHGAGGEGKSYLSKNGWKALADEKGFIALAPNGQSAKPDAASSFLLNPRLWNSGQHRADKRKAPRWEIDDIAFFKALLVEVKTLTRINERRIYVTGHSNGAGMTFRLACEMNDVFAAAAPMAGHLAVENPVMQRPIPLLWVLGELDPLRPLNGGPIKLPWGNAGEVPPSEETVETCCKLLGIPNRPVANETDALMTRRYSNAKNQVLLTTVVIKGHGHGWPGGSESGLPEKLIGPTKNTYDASRQIWAFFAEHSK